MGIQLHMVWPESRLRDVPRVRVPAGYEILVFRPEDQRGHVSLMHDAGFVGWSLRQLRQWQQLSLPDGIFVAVHRSTGEIVATAMASHRPTGLHPSGGELGWVAASPRHAGKRLGKAVSVAALSRLIAAGYRQIYLLTDDHRLAALKVYLELGFVPFLCAPDMIHRWRTICNKLDWTPDPASWVRAPRKLWVHPRPGGERPDADSLERYPPRHKWLPDRKHRGFSGTGDVDAFGDESLYKPSRLGSAVADPREVFAGDRAPLDLVFTAGPAGLHEGAAVTFVVRGQAPLSKDKMPAFSLAAPAACELEPVARGMGFLVHRGELGAGQQVTLHADPFLWTPLAGRLEFKVVVNYRDGRPEQRFPEPVVVRVHPRPAARLEATLPCTHRPGAELCLRLSARDEYDNRARASDSVHLDAGPTQADVVLVDGSATCRIPGVARGVRRVKAVSAVNAGASNPSVACDGQQLFVGDLHCHDFLSEAMGYPDEVYRWAIEDRALDFVSVVPQSHGWHDNETWTLAKYMNERYLEEGRFVPFLGFEWQHTGYGDKVVHYLGGDQPYLPKDDERYASPAGLYEALRGSDALVISHHTAYPQGAWCGGTVFDVLQTDVERLVELWSMHGSCEGYDPADRPMVRRDAERMILPALKRGIRLGFTGGSDTHAGRPGGSVKEPRPYWGGLTAVWADRLTRRDLFAALHARRTVALTGARIVLRMTVNGAPMGAELEAAERAEIEIEAWAPGPIARVEVLKNAEPMKTVHPAAETCRLQVSDATQGRAFYHCRVTLRDGNLAVCSPVWIG